MLTSMLSFLLACLLLFATSIQARILNVPSPWARIQHAVDAASDGDTIQLAPMTYNGVGNLDVKIMNKGLTIMGVGDPSQVVLDASGEAYHRGFLVIDPTSPVRFANIMIYGATGADQDTLFGWSAGGVWVQNAEITFSNCRFVKDQAINVGGAIYAKYSTVRVEDCAFDTCWAISPGGGAIYLSYCNSCTIVNSRFSHDFAGVEGAGILASHSNVAIRDCEFLDCSTHSGIFDVEGYGGAIFAAHGSTTVAHCNFFRNSTYREGGAIESWEGSFRVDSSLFVNNYVRGVYDGGPPRTGEGGAIYLLGSSSIVNSCTFIDSRTGCNSSAVVVWGDTAIVSHSIIANSDSCFAFTGSATFTCSDIFGNELGDWTGTIASQLGQNGNVSADPQFCLVFPNDYRVALGSPCDPAVSGCGLLIGSEPAGCDAVCGDADFSGRVSISDAVFLIRYIFANGAPPLMPSSGDVSCNGVVNISDVVYLVNYIFANGPVPCAACS